MTMTDVDAPRRAANVSVVSFDIFDTFLVRACTTPDGVFDSVFAHSPLAQTFPDASEHFVQHRIQAEARARKAALAAHGSSEVRIGDIYARFPFHLFGLPRDSADEYAQREFHAELRLCRPHPDTLQTYRDMRACGARTGFVSDTYWSEAQLATLLRACVPGLDWDFLFASCDHGSGKSGRLFARMLDALKVPAGRCRHIGDNPAADIAGARRHGLSPEFRPQASPRLADVLAREAAVARLLAPHRPSRLDGGARTLRRLVEARAGEAGAAHWLGLCVVGPLLQAFTQFVATQLAAREGQGRRVGLAFLGRDGFLPHAAWELTHGPVSYVEISRRAALVGAADDAAALGKLFDGIAALDAGAFRAMVKVLPAGVARLFAAAPGGVLSGAALAAQLPQAMKHSDVAAMAQTVRNGLLAHLRERIANFDGLTDLVLVDLGYAGSVQKALRRVFDRSGIRLRLHGAYLLSADEAYGELTEGDSAAGLVSDLVVTPHLKKALLRNVALLEQLCCAPQGSVRDHDGGAVRREPNPIPAAQLARVAEIQAGARAHVRLARQLAAEIGWTGAPTPPATAHEAAALLTRLLLLPGDDDLAELGDFMHDVNLGTQALVPLLDPAAARAAVIARGLPAAFTAPEPPMWLAGSFAALSPAHAFHYLLFGANHLPAGVFDETPCGTLKVGLFDAHGGARLESVPITSDGVGDLRVRIPLSRAMGVATLAVPLAEIARSGVLHGVTLQAAATADGAARTDPPVLVQASRLRGAGLAFSGSHFHAEDDKGCLLIAVAPLARDVAIYTVALALPGATRVMATPLAHAGATGA
jgi:FMN phosphatase YigB (HAD superfamily)